jgi:hypothetical protein
VTPSRLLAIADPGPVPAAALPMARWEAMSAAAAFPDAPTTLGGGEATFLSFEWEDPHADAAPAAPARGVLVAPAMAAQPADLLPPAALPALA